MADCSILAGSTSQSILVDLYVQATGAPQTALVFNSSGLTAYYSFTGASATAVAITLATLASATAAYSSGGFIKLDDTNMPGLYRLDIPNAALQAAKGRQMIITLNGFSGMATRHIKVELTGWDNQDGVHGGLSCLPNTAVTTNGSLLTSGTGTAQLSTSSGQTLVQTGTGTGQLDFTSGVVKSNLTQILGTATSTPATAGILDVNLKNIANSAVNNAVAQLGCNAVGLGGQVVSAAAGITFPSSVASPTNITAGTITTVTNLTNAATSGDFTATQKTSLNAATPASVVGSVGSVTGAVGSVVGLTASNLDTTISSRLAAVDYSAAPSAASNAAALLDATDAIETGWTIRKVLRILASVLGGKSSGAGTGTEVFRDIADAKARVTATVDSSGNRTAITLDAS